MTHKGEGGGGTISAARRDEWPRGEREAGPEERRISASVLGLCAALRPMAALAACGRRGGAKAAIGKERPRRRASPPQGSLCEANPQGRGTPDGVAALSALRPRPGAGER